MPDIKNTTRAQTIFLRAFRDHPFGPPPQLWPSPAIFRKWLRKPSFRNAFLSLRQALNQRCDFHLASAAANVLSNLACDPAQHSAQSTQHFLQLLRLSHLRQRFNPEPPPPDPSIRKQRKDDVEILLELLNSLPTQPSTLILDLFKRVKEEHKDLQWLIALWSPIGSKLRPTITPDFFEASDNPDEN
jgi:hypothetical protein